MSHSSTPNRRMSMSSSIDEHQRQGSITSLPDDDEDADQKTITTDSLIFHHQYSSSSTSPPLVSSSKGFNVEQAPPTAFFLRNDHLSQSDSTDDISATFEFQSNQTEEPKATITSTTTAVAAPTAPADDQSAGLFFDPNPEIIHKPQMIAPIIYKQNITIKFLKPPPIPQAPLIIREVRPPQPPPPPPLIIRERPARPLSPPPLILREKPPAVPSIITAQVVTKMLPPLPTPPRTVIVQKIPALPAKPADVLIERWMPYPNTTIKRKVIVERAEEPTKYPPPKNIIIEYDKPEAHVIRHFERLGTTIEDPESYQRRFGDVLLEPEELLAQVKQLGIDEDLSLPVPSEEISASSNSNFEPINRVMSSDEVERQLMENAEYFDLTNEFAKYGLRPETIPY